MIVFISILGYKAFDVLSFPVEPGRYLGIFGNPLNKGWIEFTHTRENNLVGTFSMSPKDNLGKVLWTMEVHLTALNSNEYTLSWPDNPRSSKGETLLRPVDTPQGRAYFGPFAYHEDGETRTSWAGFWLDTKLDQWSFKFPIIQYPELKEDDTGHFRSWTARADGLVNNAARSMIQTQDGFLWVGTVDGLSRFDGSHWKTIDASSAPELPGYNFRGLAQDEEGRLIAMLKHHGFFQLEGGGWRPFKCNSKLEGKDIALGSRDKHGNLWLTIDSIWLARIDKDEELRMWSIEKTMPLRHPRETVPPNLGVRIPHFGGITYTTSSGMRVFRPDTRDVPFWIPPNQGDMVQIMKDYNESLLSISLSTIIQYDDHGNIVQMFQPRSHTGTIKSVAASRFGGNWIVGANGLFFMSYNGELIRFSAVPMEIFRSGVTRMFEDRSGNLWIATGDRGLSLFRREWMGPLETEEWLNDLNNHGHPTSFALNTQSRLMVASSAFVGIWTGEEYRKVIVDPEMQHDAIVPVPNRGDAFWIAFSRSTVNPRRIVSSSSRNRRPIAALVENESTKFYYTDEFPEGVNVVSSAIWTEQQGLLIGTDSGIWVCRDGKVLNWNDENSLPRFYTTCIFLDSKRRVWIGTENSGFFMMDSKQSEQSDVVHIVKDPFESTLNYILCIDESSDGRLWIGGKDGVYLFDSESREILSDLTGNVHRPVHALVEDRSGNLWAGTSRGIYALHKNFIRKPLYDGAKGPKWILFGENDGLENTSIQTGFFPAAVELPTGELLFCMQDNVVRLHPDPLLDQAFPGPKARITRYING